MSNSSQILLVQHQYYSYICKPISSTLIESGNVIITIIRVPIFVSLRQFDLLFTVNCELHKVVLLAVIYCYRQLLNPESLIAIRLQKKR